MNKKIVVLSFLILAIIFLSGCSQTIAKYQESKDMAVSGSTNRSSVDDNQTDPISTDRQESNENVQSTSPSVAPHNSSEAATQEFAENKPSDSSVKEVAKNKKVQVMNFHATQRCASCTALGRYSEETVYEYFQAELKAGLIEFQAINVDLPENSDIANKYQARGSSLYINEIYNGQDHIVEDTKVWRLLSNEQQFKSYLKDKLNDLLNN